MIVKQIGLVADLAFHQEAHALLKDAQSSIFEMGQVGRPPVLGYVQSH